MPTHDKQVALKVAYERGEDHVGDGATLTSEVLTIFFVVLRVGRNRAFEFVLLKPADAVLGTYLVILPRARLSLRL